MKLRPGSRMFIESNFMVRVDTIYFCVKSHLLLAKQCWVQPSQTICMAR